MAHRHVVEPESFQEVADFANSVLDKCQRPAKFVHCPESLSALHKLDTYFQPSNTLVHTTRNMIKAAQNVVEKFGVTTEGGWGRTPGAIWQALYKSRQRSRTHIALIRPPSKKICQ